MPASPSSVDRKPWPAYPAAALPWCQTELTRCAGLSPSARAYG